MLDGISLTLQAIGVFFLTAAAIGVARFRDPLQRMHASTKAGTVGAGFVILGTIIRMGNTGGIIVGIATVVFLLLTIPVAGHLLGRATYVSGARLEGVEGRDALEGVLDRSDEPLDERLGGEVSGARAPVD